MQGGEIVTQSKDTRRFRPGVLSLGDYQSRGPDCLPCSRWGENPLLSSLSGVTLPGLRSQVHKSPGHTKRV